MKVIAEVVEMELQLELKNSLNVILHNDTTSARFM